MQFSQVNDAAIQKIIRYISYFSDPSQTFFVNNGSHALEAFSYAEGVENFITDLYDGGFIQPFEWANWQENAEVFINDADKLSKATKEELHMLLIYHVRKERFHNGHFAGIIDNGHLTNLLQRLKALQ